MNTKKILLFTSIVGIFGLTACGGAAKFLKESPTSNPVIPRASETLSNSLDNDNYPAPGTDSITNTLAPITELIPPTLDQDGSPQPGEQIEASEPEVKSALVATDPKSVQLASGRLQLIEFFAFW